MKKIIFLLTGVILLAACQKISFEDIDNPKTKSEIRILTRSANNVDVSYPIYLYAFDISSGEMLACSTLHSETDTPVLNLGAGTYHLVAVAGIQDCEVPEEPNLNSLITLPEEARLQQPLQMGSADVTVSKSTTATITLYNQVTAINIALRDMAEDISTCNVSFSMMYNAISYGGKLAGGTVTTVELTKQENNIWSAPLFYSLPSSNQQLTLSINSTSPQMSNTYGYTHNTQLNANTPYNIMGSYKTGFVVNGVINLAGWNAPQEINFTFGAGSNENEDDSDEEDNEDTDEEREEYTVNSIPKVGTIWNNHFVATVLDATASEAELLLLSTTEWDGVTSATHAETPYMAANFAASYAEDGMTNWSIPTRDEAKLMRTAIGLDMLETINAVLKANNIPQLNIGESDKGESIRYLCDDATFTFVWDGTSVSKCGTKRTYNLRLVKRVKVVVK